jgi:hypothetical protein
MSQVSKLSRPPLAGSDTGVKNGDDAGAEDVKDGPDVDAEDVKGGADADAEDPDVVSGNVCPHSSQNAPDCP